MNRKKRISTELLEKYPDKFGPEFDANKKALHEIATVTSKVLRNEVAGYMASHLRTLSAASSSTLRSSSAASSLTLSAPDFFIMRCMAARPNSGPEDITCRSAPGD